MEPKPIYLSEQLVRTTVYGVPVTGLILFRSFTFIEVAIVHPYHMLFENWLIHGIFGGTHGLFGRQADRYVHQILHSSHIAASHLMERIPKVLEELRADHHARDRFRYRMEAALPLGTEFTNTNWHQNVAMVNEAFGYANSAYPWNTPILRRSHQHQADVLLYRALMGDPVDLHASDLQLP
jgi:hypothetical protein